MMRSSGLLLSLAFLLPASAQNSHFFTGRYHCGGLWRDFEFRVTPAMGLLGVVDPDEGVTATFKLNFRRSITSTDSASYRLKGTFDDKTGHFRFEPLEWAGAHPAVLETIGIEGTFDAKAHKASAHMLSNKCDVLEMVPQGETLPPLPPETSARTPGRDPKRPETLLGMTNVTNYLDVAAHSSDFEYLVTAWYDSPGTIHETSAIDESVAGMKKEKFACGGSQHVTWDATGTKGTAPDRVGVTERYVIECVGDCKGVFYSPFVGAQVIHFGLMQPLPTMQIKSVFLGGTTFKWNFSRTNPSQPPPEIYVHRWVPLVGFGPMDPGPAEIARRIAAAPPCKAPVAGSR